MSTISLNTFQKYQEQYINTLTPEDLVTLLYNETTKNLNKSISDIDNKQTSLAHNHIIKAQDIILHLISTLDFNYSISNELLPLYEFMYDSLVKANIQKDTQLIKVVLKMVNDLKDAWVEAIKINRYGSTALGKSV